MEEMEEQKQIENTLKELPFWDNLSASEKDRIKDYAVIRSYPKGTDIYSIDSDCLGMIKVLKGSLRIYILSEEGREVTLFHIREGEACVLSASCFIHQIDFDTTIIAETDTEFLLIGNGLFRPLSEENIYVRCFMYELLAERFSAVMQTFQDILFKGYDRRLATFFITAYDTDGKSTLTMTHEEIAKQTSSAREVVARTLKRFAAQGLVELNRGKVTLKDIPSLRKLV